MNKEIREEFEKLEPMPLGVRFGVHDGVETYTHTEKKFIQVADRYRSDYLYFKIGYCQAGQKASLKEITRLGELQTLMEENEKLKKEIERLNFLLRGEE